MIDLRTLGTFALRDTARGGSQDLTLAPRPAALLVYLAVARPHGRITRDRLLSVFWPQLPEPRARAALSQTLYRLRVELGRDVVATAGDGDVGLRPDEVRCDAVDFDLMLDEGESERALELYAGELLPGFHGGASPAFEHWLDETRARLRQRAIEAASTLANRSEAAGNPVDAANWLRRALVLAPYDEPILRELARILVALGDRSGATREYNTFAARLSKDLELEPSASLRSVMALLRTTEPEVALRFDAVSSRPVETALPEAPPPTGDPKHAARRIPRWVGLSVAGVATFATLAAIVLQGFGVSIPDLRAAAEPVELRPNRVLVLPFEERNQIATAPLIGRVAADWIIQSLLRTGLVEVIDATTAFRLLADGEWITANGVDVAQLRQLAGSTRAATIVWGSVAQHNADIEFRVHLTDARDGSVLRSLDPVVATSGNITPALDALRTRVAGALATVVDERLATIVAPSSAPPKFEAYQEYALGLDRFFAPDWDGAFTHFQRAAELDSAFTMARFWAIYAAANGGRRETQGSLILALEPLREGLPPVEQAALDMFSARWRGDFESALSAARRAAKLSPQSSWSYMAAFMSLDLGRPQESLKELAELDPTRGWLKDWRPYWENRLIGLHRIEAYEDELEAARLAQQTYRPDQPLMHQRFFISELQALAALKRFGQLEQRLRSIDSIYLANDRPPDLAFIHYALGVELRAHGSAARSEEHFQRCLELYAQSTRPGSAKGSCSYELGRHQEAGAEPSLSSAPGYAYVTAGLAAARLGRREEAERHLLAMDSLLVPGNPTRETTIRFDQARIAFALGQQQRARTLLHQAPLRGVLWALLHTTSDLDSLRADPIIAAVVHPRN